MTPGPGPSRGTLALASLSVALGAALAWVLANPPSRVASSVAVMRADAELRGEIVDELVARGAGVWDAHPDPDVGRTLQPGLEDREYHALALDSNALGLREREIAYPKPPGTLRVVLLGDSFVFGDGAEAEDRLGAWLERSLRERARRPAARIECLHVAASSWNFVAEAEFVRRQLDLLQPDLVVQVAVTNDLDDGQGVRGFGSKSDFAPELRDRANSRVWLRYPRIELGRDLPNMLLEGFDEESRARWAAASRSIQRLVDALEARGAEYLLLSHWGPRHATLRALLDVDLSPAQRAYLPLLLVRDPSYWVADDDPHWNARGHELVARAIHHHALEHGLLSALDLPPWPEVEGELGPLLRAERELAEQPESEADRFARCPHTTEILPAALDDVAAAHVYGGLDREGRAAPHATFALGCAGGRTIELRLAGLGRAVLDDVPVDVVVEGRAIGTVRVPADGPVEASLELPADLRDRLQVGVRLVARDWVHVGERMRDCRAYRLERLAIAR